LFGDDKHLPDLIGDGLTIPAAETPFGIGVNPLQPDDKAAEQHQ